MIIYLLILTLICPGIVMNGSITRETTLSSPEEASIYLYKENLYTGLNKYYEGELYEIDLKNKTIKEISIPKMEFK